MGLIDDIHKDLERGVIRLIVEYRERLRSEAVGLCKDESLAEDLVFRTIERALSKIDTYKEDTNLFGWMRSIMTHIYRNDLKRLSVKRTVFVEADELERCAGADWSTDEQLLKNSDSEAIRKALAELDPKSNQVLMMRYYGGFTLKQIAMVLQLPLGTVCRRMQIAHGLLAGKLGVMLGRTKKPLAVLLAVFSLSILSFAAVFNGWLTDGDDRGTGVPPVQEDSGGTGVSPVQAETVSEPKQEDTQPTQQDIPVTTKGDTMNTKSIAAVASAILLGTAANGDSIWQYNTPDPTWWFTEGAWDVYPPSGNVTLLKKTKFGQANICLKDGDEVTVGDVKLSEANFTTYCGNSFFQIQKGAKFTFTGTMEPCAYNLTNVIDIAGGTVRGNIMLPGGKLGSPSSVFITNGADVAVNTLTLGNASPSILYVEDSTLQITNNASGTMTLNGNVKFVQRSGTTKILQNDGGNNAFVTKSGVNDVPTVEIYGGTVTMTNAGKGGVFLDLSEKGKPTYRQYGGTVASCGFRFGATGENTPRAEIYGGKFFAYGQGSSQGSSGVFNKSKVLKGGVFSIYGGAPEVRMQRIGTYDANAAEATQPQIEYVICTNGIPTIYMDSAPESLYNWVSGYFSIRPLGGVQLVHTNVVTLLDGTAAGRMLSCQNLDAGGMIFPNALLWERGQTSAQPAIKVTLKDEAELTDGAYYAEGKSCGYLKIPRVGANWRTASVHLDLVPQGDETLDTLVAGFTAAGYAAKRINGTYNVKLRIPRELLVDGSADEKILIDFSEYADAEAVRDAQPTVRARVRRARFVHDPGLVLFLR